MRDISIEATSSIGGKITFNLRDLFRKNPDLPVEYRIIDQDLSNNNYTECIIVKRCIDDPSHYDNEDAHLDADVVLLEYIGDKEIAEAWYDVPKWYS